MTVMSSLQTRALFHIYIIIKSNFGVLNDFWCNGDFGFGMVSGERQRAARREGAREPHGAKNAPPNHEHQIDHHTLNLIIMIYIISYILKSFFCKNFSLENYLFQYSMLYSDRILDKQRRLF